MTPKQKRWFNRAEIALWALAAGALLFHLTPAAAPQPVADGQAAPSFSVSTLSGGKVDLARLRGHVVLVNFWATWCPPCRMEIPGLQAVYQEYRDRGFVVVGLSTDQGGKGAVQQFVRESGVTYPVAMATPGVMRLYGGIDMLPQSFLVDQHGKVVKMVTGAFGEGILRHDVQQLLSGGAL